MPRKPDSKAVTFDDRVEIELTQGLVATVDLESYPLVKNYRWCALKKGNTYYAKASRRDGSCKMMYMHHVICPDFLLVDHKDGNGLNNRRGNLRQATAAENSFNKRSVKHTSKHHGVVWHPRAKKWVVYIRHDGIKRYVGVYSTEDDAYAARLEAERKYHPKFLRTVA